MKHALILWGAVALITRLLPTLSINMAAHPVSCNESKAEATREPLLYYNSLLNGHSLDHANFSLSSQGQLTVVASNPDMEYQEKIPFQIYLRRNGVTIQQGASDTARSVLSVDVTTVLALAQPGDMLVIESTRKSDARANRRIKLKEFIFMPNLFSFFRNEKNGC
jgi:hypothetical protein